MGRTLGRTHGRAKTHIFRVPLYIYFVYLSACMYVRVYARKKNSQMAAVCDAHGTDNDGPCIGRPSKLGSTCSHRFGGKSSGFHRGSAGVRPVFHPLMTYT